MLIGLSGMLLLCMKGILNSKHKLDGRYAAGLLAFLLGMTLHRWGHGSLHAFGEGAFSGAAIILMLMGVWRSRSAH
jgi:hypothetical protein